MLVAELPLEKVLTRLSGWSLSQIWQSEGAVGRWKTPMDNMVDSRCQSGLIYSIFHQLDCSDAAVSSNTVAVAMAMASGNWICRCLVPGDRGVH
jgi:hypothetical protein